MIWLCTTKTRKSKFVVKRLMNSGTASKETLDDYLQEIEITQSLKHKRILAIDDYFKGDVSKDIHIVSPFVDGGELLDLIKAGTLESEERQKIMADLFSTLEYVHRNNVLH